MIFVCAGACVCGQAPGIVSLDKSLRYRNTFMIIIIIIIILWAETLQSKSSHGPWCGAQL